MKFIPFASALISLAATAFAADPPGTILLTAKSVIRSGWAEGSPSWNNAGVIGHWDKTNKVSTWKVTISERKTFRIFLESSCDDSNAGSTFELSIGGQIIRGTQESTGAFNTPRITDLGPILIRKPGDLELVVRPIKITRSALMNLKSVKLVPEH